MSRFVVNLDEPQPEKISPAGKQAAPQSDYAPKVADDKPRKKRSGCLKYLGILGALLLIVLLIGGIGSYFYWQSLKKTPQYSLALIVDAARRDDKDQIARLLDTDQVINSFVPQITDKAIELYGRGLPAGTIARVSQVAAPLIPAIKERVKAELPRLIREKTKPVESVPYWVIAVFASRGVEIKEEGDMAYIKSKIAERPLEITMKRNGDVWQIIAVKDDVLAKNIADKIGQEIIAATTKGGLDKIGKQTGIPNLSDTLKKIDSIFK